MKKRLLAVLLTLVMCIAMWPLSALAADGTLTGVYAGGVVTVTGEDLVPGKYIIDVRTQSGDAIALGNAATANGDFTVEITTGALERNAYELKAYLWDGSLAGTFTVAGSTVTVNVSPSGAGSVTGGGSYEPGAEVTLTAISNSGYRFNSWSATGLTLSSTTSNPLKFIMPEDDVTITANFRRISSGGSSVGSTTTPEEDPDEDKTPEDKSNGKVEESRLAGYSRMDTAIALSQKGWPEKADAVVVAYAYSFPDALAAAPLAYKEDAPILLTDNQRITSSTLTEIQRLNPAKVILVGGTAVLSTEVENTLRESYQVTRYAGYDRYETAAQIADAMGTTGTAVVVNGEVYQDALAISSYAANQGIPVLFTQRDVLPDVTAGALNRLGVSKTIVTGGTGVVSAEVYAGLPNPVRYAGYDCYETAAAVAVATELNMNLENVYVVTGIDFADALVAGNLAAHTLAPLLMVGGGDSLPAATENFFRTNKAKIKGFTVVGGTVVVPENQVDTIRNIFK